MMSDLQPPAPWPQWLISPLAWVLALFATLIIGGAGWFWRVVWLRVTTVEGAVKDLALKHKDLQLEMAPLISRNELVAHLTQMREESDAKFSQLRDDRQRMHQEHLDRAEQLREQIVENGNAVRADIRSVHARIDDVFKTIR